MPNITLPIDPVFGHLIPYLNGIKHRRPVLVEIGVHHAQSTPMLWLACARPPIWYGFEPDPRNLEVLDSMGVTVYDCAVSDQDGCAEMRLSSGTTPGTVDREHTDSSSLNEPTKHLEAHPWCKFERTEMVETKRLDGVVSHERVFDLIWCDVQGAQRKVISGARETLAKTRMLYIEVHPEPMYEDEPTFEELLQLLPGWEVVERYPADVLLHNPAAEALG